jgi:hypothetical protein
MSTFDETLNRPPATAWKRNGYEPNPLIGTVTFRYTNHHVSYGDAEVLGILSESDQRVYSVLCGNAVLRGFVEAEGPKAGERVGLKYLGEVQSRDGNTYANFNAAVDREARSPGTRGFSSLACGAWGSRAAV